jgi:HK97 family phage prohead protease
MENKIQNKAFITSFTDDTEGLLKAFVSVYGNVDSANEICDYGCFKDALAYKLPVLCLYHNWEKPIGVVLKAEEIPAGDPRLPEDILSLGGLYIEAQINLDKQLGKDAWSDIKLKVLSEYSIGYVVQESYVDKDGVKHLTKVDLIEASPVVRAANRLTSTIEIKSQSFTKTQINEKQMNEYLDSIQMHLVEAMAPLDALKTEMASQGILAGELETKFNALSEPLQNALGFLDDLKIMLTEQGLLETIAPAEAVVVEAADATKDMHTEGTLSSLTEILTGLTALENEEVTPFIDMVQNLIATIESEEVEPMVEVTETADLSKAVETAGISEKTELENLFSNYLKSQTK